jgi:hypothetical protein
VQALRQHALRRHEPLWRSPPLRLLSSRAVSCGRRLMLAFKALVTSQLQSRDAEIRFCSVSQSGFEPSLSGFVPAPTDAVILSLSIGCGGNGINSAVIEFLCNDAKRTSGMCESISVLSRETLAHRAPSTSMTTPPAPAFHIWSGRDRSGLVARSANRRAPCCC